MSVRRPFFAPVGLAAVAAVLLGACGGGEATATPAPTQSRPTQAPPATPTPVSATATARPAVTAAPSPTPAAAATATPPGPTPKYGGTFRMRMIQDFYDLDSRGAIGQFAVIWSVNLLNNLITYKPDEAGKALGDLAATWQVSENGLVWSFALRKDVKWHDGTPFTTKDVLYTFNTYLKPESPAATVHKARMTAVEKIETPDDSSFRMTLSRPSASLLAALTVPSVVVYPAHIAYTSEAYRNKPIGTGAYTFVGYQRDVVIKLAKNPGYWRKDDAGRALPYMDGLEYYIITDRSTLQAAFQAARLDCLCGYGSDVLVTELEQVKSRNPGLKFSIVRAASLITLQFNQRAPLNDQRVRQGIHAGLDRKETNSLFLEGNGYYPPGYLIPQAAGGQWALQDQEALRLPGFREPKEQDRALTRQLFQQAGLDPSKTRLNILSSSRFQDVAAVVDSELRKQGFQQSRIDLLDGAASTAALNNGNFDVNILQFGLSYDDPGDQLNQSIITNGARNFGKWSSKEIDGLAEQQDAVLDPAKRRDVIYELQRKALDAAFVVPLLDQVSVYATQGYVMDFVLNRAIGVTPAHRLDRVWLNR